MSDVVVPSAGAAAESGVIDKGLKKGAIGLLSTTVIGVASTAPGYSLAASLGFVVAAGSASGIVGAQAPAILWLAFVPMLFIAASYFYLNRADPDCGTTFTWATRAIGPKTGWIGGWAIIVADLVVMPSLADITGRYVFLLFDANGLANDTFWRTFVGVAFILLMTVICVIGIELNARTQFLLLAAELVVLAIFSVVAFVKVYSGDLGGSVKPSLSWVNPFEISSVSALSGGILVAVFIYWGWDTAVTVNEETKDSRRTPGVAALASTVVLVLTYLIVAIAAQAVRGAGFLDRNNEDVLSAVGSLVLDSPFDKLLIIAVLTSAAASTQTTILPAARSTLSMAVHKAFPERLGDVSPRYLTPAKATWVFGIVSAVWYAGLAAGSQNVLADSIASVGLMIAFYYAMTAFACVIYFWKYLFTSLKTFVLVGLSSFLGGAILTFVFFKSIIDFTDPANGESGDSWFGWAPPLVIGVGLMLIGIPIMLVWWARHPEFFRRGRDPVDQRPAPDGTGPIPPPILGVGPILDDAPLAPTSTGGGD